MFSEAQKIQGGFGVKYKFDLVWRIRTVSTLEPSLVFAPVLLTVISVIKLTTVHSIP